MTPDLIGIAGRYGPVRRRAHLTYTATCLACMTDAAMTIHITPTGDRPTCRAGCHASEIHKAFAQLAKPDSGAVTASAGNDGAASPALTPCPRCGVTQIQPGRDQCTDCSRTQNKLVIPGRPKRNPDRRGRR